MNAPIEYIQVTTPAGKRALAAALAVHDPDTLATIVMLSKAIGGTMAVYYLAEDAEIMRRVVKGIDTAAVVA